MFGGLLVTDHYADTSGSKVPAHQLGGSDGGVSRLDLLLMIENGMVVIYV